MANSTILVVEDDSNLLAVLKYNLDREGYRVITAVDGAQALEKAHQVKPDLIILDIMLPELNGYEVCRILRRETTTPILMLTAKAEEVDTIVGLEIGADDYVTKPFSMRELLARVRAMLRRSGTAGTASTGRKKAILIDDLQIYADTHRVFLNGLEITLSPKEFELLAFLAQNKGLVFKREQLLERVWGYDYTGDTRTVDVHIRWLRQKIEHDPSHPRRLLTIRGTGYKMGE